jgi:hypothetical protein
MFSSFIACVEILKMEFPPLSKKEKWDYPPFIKVVKIQISAPVSTRIFY